MKQTDSFSSLTQNAFDFLKRGISEFDESPKYSVIHFCAAVEMMLKARLMKEHWSLIVSKPDQANRDKFTAGDFISVTLEEARARIRDVVGDDIGDDAHASFRTLANHRNKMVHFFHPGLERDEKIKDQIVAEQCRAWFYLHRLLTRWEAYFDKFSKEIAQADRAMKGHKKYLSTKFKALKDDIEAERKKGKVPCSCSACDLEAALPTDLDAQLTSLCCLVCDHTEIRVTIECPECSESLVFAGEGYAKCKHCGKKFDSDDLLPVLSDSASEYQAAMDGDDSWGRANCADCDGYHTVVRRPYFHFCTNCFAKSDSVSACGFCNDLNTGDMEDSYFLGCNHCDGKSGWDSDD